MARGEVFEAGSIELTIFPGGGVTRLTRGPPAGGGTVEFIGGVEKIIGNGAIGVEKSGGALAFALEESVGGAGFSVATEESLGACHLACGHTGFSLERSIGGVELPVAFG